MAHISRLAISSEGGQAPAELPVAGYGTVLLQQRPTHMLAQEMGVVDEDEPLAVVDVHEDGGIRFDIVPEVDATVIYTDFERAFKRNNYWMLRTRMLGMIDTDTPMTQLTPGNSHAGQTTKEAGEMIARFEMIRAMYLAYYDRPDTGEVPISSADRVRSKLGTTALGLSAAGLVATGLIVPLIAGIPMGVATVRRMLNGQDRLHGRAAERFTRQHLESGYQSPVVARAMGAISFREKLQVA